MTASTIKAPREIVCVLFLQAGHSEHFRVVTPGGDGYALYHRVSLTWSAYFGNSQSATSLATFNNFLSAVDFSVYMTSALKAPA